MKLLSLFFAVLFCPISYGQINYTNSENYSASCDESEMAGTYNSSAQVRIVNDSIIIEDVLWNQCCPQFELKISDIFNDTLYVTFLDTTNLVCDCMCDFNVRINAGKADSYSLKVNYNGTWFTLLPNDYMPLIEMNKSWNSLELIPGLENIIPEMLEHTIESDEQRYFCWNGKKYYEVKTIKTKNEVGIQSVDTTINYIREVQGKVYILNQEHIAEDGCDEALLYDFTLNAEDTVCIGFDSVKYRVESTGRDEESKRRTLTLSELSIPGMVTKVTWIEGIGDTRGLFQSMRSLHIDGSYNVLTCCSVEDTLIYENDDYPNCGTSSVYNFFIASNKHWTTVVTCPENIDTTYIKELSITKDNIDSNIFDMRFYPDSNTEKVFYQEINGKVFYNDGLKQFLIYDFSLRDGDTVIVGDSDIKELTLIVDSVKYLKIIDNISRKTLYLRGDIEAILVEGFGDLSSHVEYWNTHDGCTLQNVCCELNGEYIYQNPLYPDCTVLTSINTKVGDELNIFPNPAKDFIIVEGMTGNEYSYQLINTLGVVQKEGVIDSQIDLNLANGVYFLLIKDYTELVKIERIIVSCK